MRIACTGVGYHSCMDEGRFSLGYIGRGQVYLATYVVEAATRGENDACNLIPFFCHKIIMAIWLVEEQVSPSSIRTSLGLIAEIY